MKTLRHLAFVLCLAMLASTGVTTVSADQPRDADLLERVKDINPTPSSPVSSEEDKRLLKKETALLMKQSVDEVVAHRTAAACFGEIEAGSPRVSRDIVVDPAQTRWHSTGLYAAPGEKLRVKLPPGAAEKGVWIRIGGHLDNIARRPAWKRMPRVHRAFLVKGAEGVVASPFGGAVYIDIGDNPPFSEPFKVTIENAVPAPYFVLGETSDEEWIDNIRDYPAPYAELVCEHLCISLPSKYIRNLDNPTELMRFWDKTVAGHDWLGGHAHLRKFPDRINIDVQISVGAAHSGYPTQGNKAWGLLDLDHLLREGSWGWFHELGHEAQARPDKRWPHDNYYTFDGSIECTVNLYSSHARDMHGIKGRSGWGWTSYPELVMRKALEVVEDPEKSYASVGVAHKLAMMLQLRDAFGWDTWAEVLSGYTRDFDKGAISGRWSDQRKRDEFLLRFSQACGHDLTRWMRDYWKVAVSDQAVAKVAELDLPEWLPATGGIQGVANVETDGHEFDLGGSLLSFDGKAELVSVEQPRNGRLEEVGQGVWRYSPAPGFTGRDSFSYTVRSSSGHKATAVVEPRVEADKTALRR